MPAFTIVITVATLLIGGQALFLDVLRAGLVVTVAAALLGAASRALGGPLAAAPVRGERPRPTVPVEWGSRPGG